MRLPFCLHLTFELSEYMPNIVKINSFSATTYKSEREMSKIIAVDFDGTVVRHEYPEIGKDIPHAVDVLKELNKSGTRIIVWTMRCGEYLDVHAKEWFESREIKVWAYNNNPEQSDWTKSPKCYAQAYIDDSSIGCPLIYPGDGGRPYVDWIKIEQELIKRGFLSKKV